MPKRLSHQAVSVSLTITGSLLFALTLFEATLRSFPLLVTPEIQEFIQATPEDKGVSHPYIGHLHKPNHSFTLAGRDFRAVHHTDGFGFRNGWPWPERAEIVALGDSVTFGQGVEDGQAWPAILARSLPGARLINLGLIGAGPQQYLRAYETFGTKLHPKLLLVGLFLRNDLWDDDTFDRWLKSGAGGNYTVWRDFGRPKRVFSPDEPIKSAIRKLQWDLFLWARRSYLFNLALHVTGAARKWRPDEVRLFELPDGQRLELLPGDFTRKIKGAYPGHPEFELTLDALKRIRSIGESHGTKVLVIFLPGKEEAYLPLLGVDVPDFAAPLRQELKRLGITHLDLGPAFRDRAAKGEKLFFEADGHPNARGYALIAELVVSHLKGNAERYGLKDFGKISSNHD
jgi:lysophospholipase L1-like esterase